MGAAAIVAGIGTGLQVGGKLYEGYAQNKYYQYLAQQNEKQGKQVLTTAGEQAGFIYDKAASEQGQTREKLNQTAADAKTGMAANNVSLSSKTAEDIARSAFNAENKDEAAIRYNADVSAWQTFKNANLQKDALYAQAEGYRRAGKNALTSSYIDAFSSLLGGAAQIAGSKAK